MFFDLLGAHWGVGQGYGCAELHHKVGALHWQNIMYVSRHQWVMDYHRDVLSVPLMGVRV